MKPGREANIRDLRGSIPDSHREFVLKLAQARGGAEIESVGIRGGGAKTGGIEDDGTSIEAGQWFKGPVESEGGAGAGGVFRVDRRRGALQLDGERRAGPGGCRNYHTRLNGLRAGQ